MNFISHFYSINSANNFASIGSVFPDLYGQGSFTKIYNKHIRNINIDNFQNDQKEFFSGIIKHYKDDSLFHLFDDFKQFNYDSIDYFSKNKYLKDIPRKNFISHILYELVLDSIVIEKNPSIVDKFYKSLNDINIENLYKYYISIVFHQPIPFEIFQSNITNFIKLEFAKYYTKDSNLIVALYKSTNRIVQWQIDDLIFNELLEYIKISKPKIDYIKIFNDLK